MLVQANGVFLLNKNFHVVGTLTAYQYFYMTPVLMISCANNSIFCYFSEFPVNVSIHTSSLEQSE